MKRKRKPLWLRELLVRRMIVALLLLGQIVFIIATIIHYQQLQWLHNLMTAISVIISIHLLTRRDEKSAFKLSLVFIILLFPLFGGALYCILQYQTTNIGIRRKISKIQKCSQAAYRCSKDNLQAATADCPESKKQLYYLQSTLGFPVCKRTETVYFSDGNEMLASLLTELKKAKKYIFLEFFIIEEGKFWNSVLEVLCERAQNGVDVRVIYDDIGCLLRLPQNYRKRLQKHGIQCAVFNPFRPFLTSTQNNRDHRKIIVIDGEIAYTGGINLADEYLNEKVLFGRWKDNAVLLRGDGAWSFTVMFLQMWSFLQKQEYDLLSYLPEESSKSVRGVGWVQPYCDSPMDREHVGEHVYLNVIGQAQQYLYITTPYLTIDGTLMSALKLAAKNGVDVRIITPGHPDKKAVHFTSRSYYRELIRAGVKIYEYTDGFIHSKCFLADDLVGTVGTVNLDFRSLYLHFECGCCLYRTPSLLDLKADYLKTMESCQEITDRDCKTNFFVRICQDFCRIFAPLM